MDQIDFWIFQKCTQNQINWTPMNNSIFNEFNEPPKERKTQCTQRKYHKAMRRRWIGSDSDILHTKHAQTLNGRRKWAVLKYKLIHTHLCLESVSQKHCRWGKSCYVWTKCHLWIWERVSKNQTEWHSFGDCQAAMIFSLLTGDISFTKANWGHHIVLMLMLSCSPVVMTIANKSLTNSRTQKNHLKIIIRLRKIQTTNTYFLHFLLPFRVWEKRLWDFLFSFLLTSLIIQFLLHSYDCD